MTTEKTPSDDSGDCFVNYCFQSHQWTVELHNYLHLCLSHSQLCYVLCLYLSFSPVKLSICVDIFIILFSLQPITLANKQIFFLWECAASHTHSLINPLFWHSAFGSPNGQRHTLEHTADGYSPGYLACYRCFHFKTQTLNMSQI